MVNMITALCGYFSGTFVSDTGGTFKSDTPGTFVSDIGGTFEVILSVEGLCIVKFPVPMAAVVNPRDPVPLRKSNVDNWKEFYNKASIKPANESSKFLCFISPEFRKENQILFLDQLQDYLQNKGLGEIEFS